MSFSNWKWWRGETFFRTFLGPRHQRASDTSRPCHGPVPLTIFMRRVVVGHSDAGGKPCRGQGEPASHHSHNNPISLRSAVHPPLPSPSSSLRLNYPFSTRHPAPPPQPPPLAKVPLSALVIPSNYHLSAFRCQTAPGGGASLQPSRGVSGSGSDCRSFRLLLTFPSVQSVFHKRQRLIREV